MLLPCAAGSWTPELLAVVIRHEEARTLRHDTLWQAISDAARALYRPRRQSHASCRERQRATRRDVILSSL